MVIFHSYVNVYQRVSSTLQRLLHLLHFDATAIRQPHGWLPGIKDRIDLAQERLPQNPGCQRCPGHTQIINQQ